MKKTVEARKGRKNKIFLIFICVFLGAAIIFGSTFAVVLGVKNKNAVVSYEGIRMNEGVAAFFLSYYKTTFLSAIRSTGVDAYDTEDFWQSEYEDGTTYGEYYLSSANEYLRQVCAAAALFDEFVSLSSADKSKIKNTLKEVIDYKASSDKSEFNALAAEYGFDYSDFADAAEILYKVQTVRKYVFGTNGENLAALPSAYQEYAISYFERYTRVKLLFIRTEDKFVLDADGNRVVGNDGNDTLVELSDEEKAQRAETISLIRGAIAAAENGGDGAMNPIMFENLLKAHNEGDKEMNDSGYYFHPNAQYTAAFSEALSDVVEKSYEMEIGSYGEVKTDFGICFIYKCSPDSYALNSIDEHGCLSDFYSDASDYIFTLTVEDMAKEVNAKEEKLLALDPLSIGANYALVPKF